MTELTNKEFIQIRDYLKNTYGISLNDDKKGLVTSRLRTRLQDKGLSNYTDYFKFLTQDKTGMEAQFFINALSTNHTFFMREADHFDYLKDAALPWVEALAKDRDIRIWCAASSSGEEPYTLQIIMQEYFQMKPGWNTQLLATDISEKVLNKAVHGLYSNESLSALPAAWRVKYFKKYNDESMIATDELKRLIAFRKFNLMDEHFPFKRPFHIVFCRNVMIYFDPRTRDDLVKRFYDHMVPGGFLFIGHAESLNQTNTQFKYDRPAVYRKPS
ncbi:MAG: protein-glutamate O-methyltransferase CheR [Clostridiales bacterium]|nr:protein-glutamate O-methyltransferase CheR [Clostridiales bacterium]